MQRDAIEAASQMAPSNVKAQATAQLDAMKAGGLMSRTGEYLQPLNANGRAYLQNMRQASSTGRMPAVGMRLSGFGGASAGGVNGMNGGGFMGAISASLPQNMTTSTPDLYRAMGGPANINRMLAPATAPGSGDRGWAGRGQQPPPVPYQPNREGSRPTGLPGSRR